LLVADDPRREILVERPLRFSRANVHLQHQAVEIGGIFQVDIIRRTNRAANFHENEIRFIRQKFEHMRSQAGYRTRLTPAVEQIHDIGIAKLTDSPR